MIGASILRGRKKTLRHQLRLKIRFGGTRLGILASSVILAPILYQKPNPTSTRCVNNSAMMQILPMSLYWDIGMLKILDVNIAWLRLMF